MIVQANLYQGDCIEIMQGIPDESIDMILCDLPYGTTKNAWDTLIPFDALWTAYGRIIKPHGAIILFSQQPFTAELIMSNKKMFRYEWIWQKANATGFLNAKKMPLKCHENVLVFYKKLPVYNPQMRTGFKPYRIKSGKQSKNYGEQTTVETVSNGERYPIDIIQFAGVNMMDGAKTEHPTQKPVDLLEYLIRTYSTGGTSYLIIAWDLVLQVWRRWLHRGTLLVWNRIRSFLKSHIRGSIKYRKHYLERRFRKNEYSRKSGLYRNYR